MADRVTRVMSASVLESSEEEEVGMGERGTMERGGLRRFRDSWVTSETDRRLQSDNAEGVWHFFPGFNSKAKVEGPRCICCISLAIAYT